MVRSLAIVNGQEAMNTKEKLGAAIVIGYKQMEAMRRRSGDRSRHDTEL
jgi:hypothetical protein